MCSVWGTEDWTCFVHVSEQSTTWTAFPVPYALLFFGGTGNEPKASDKLNPHLLLSHTSYATHSVRCQSLLFLFTGRKMRPQTLFSEKVYNYIHTEGQLDWFQLLRWHTSGDVLVANKTENIERHGNEEPISPIYPESGENATDQREKSTVCLANINSDSPHHHHLHHHRARQ